MDCLLNRTIKLSLEPILVNKIQVQQPEYENFTFVNNTLVEKNVDSALAKIITLEHTIIQPYSNNYIRCKTSWRTEKTKPSKLFLMATRKMEDINCGIPESHLSARNLIRIYNNSHKIACIDADTEVATGYEKQQFMINMKDLQLVSHYLLSRSEATRDNQKILD